jgi:hypothetical protein
VPSSNYIILTDDVLNSLHAEADRAEAVTLPRKRFAALCLQAMRNADDDPARILMPCHEIRELMTNPLNAIAAALSVDTLRKLCRQAMTHPGAIDPIDFSTAVSRDHAPPKPGKPRRFGQ